MSEPNDLPAGTLDALIREGSRAGDEFRAATAGRDHRYVECDVRGAHEALRTLRAGAATFIELGSATGVVTVLADLLGYEAYGIEIEPWLVERATELAEQFDSGAVFAEGSFVPPDAASSVERPSGAFHTAPDDSSGFDALGLELADFDLVFAYPWPGEEAWLRDLVAQNCGPGTLLLTFDSGAGFRVEELGRA